MDLECRCITMVETGTNVKKKMIVPLMCRYFEFWSCSQEKAKKCAVPSAPSGHIYYVEYLNLRSTILNISVRSLLLHVIIQKYF